MQCAELKSARDASVALNRQREAQIEELETISHETHDRLESLEVELKAANEAAAQV